MKNLAPIFYVIFIMGCCTVDHSTRTKPDSKPIQYPTFNADTKFANLNQREIIMSALDRIKEMQAQLDKITAQIEKYTEEENSLMAQAEAVGDKKEALMREQAKIADTLNIVVELSKEAEERAQETFQAAQDAFATLFTKYKGGGITDADFAQFSEASGIGIPIEEGGEDAESETEELAATGT